MNEPEKFGLSKQDLNSPTWARLMGYFEDRLQRLRMENDMEMDIERTNIHRGRIAELKAIMSLDKEY